MGRVDSPRHAEAQVLASGVANGKTSMALVAINVGYLAIGYALMGAIIGALTA